MKRVTFIKIFLIEITWVTVVALVSAGLYHLSVGIDLSYANYYSLSTSRNDTAFLTPRIVMQRVHTDRQLSSEPVATLGSF